MVTKNARPWWVYRLFIPAVVLMIGWFGAKAFAQHYKVVFVGDSSRCIPGWVFIVERGVLPRRGDLAMFLSPETPVMPAGYNIIKVVAGIANDTVTITPFEVSNSSQRWYAPINEASAFLNIELDELTGSITVPEGELFMLGTFNGSYDSRFFGTIKTEQVIGRAFILI